METDDESRTKLRTNGVVIIGHVLLGALYVPIAHFLPMRGDLDAFLWLGVLSGLWAGAGPKRAWKLSLGMTSLSITIATIILLIYNYQKSMESVEHGGRGSEGGEFFIILSWPFTLLLAVIVGLIVRGAISLITWLWRKIARNAEPDSAL